MTDDKTLKAYTEKATAYAALDFSESEKQALDGFLQRQQRLLREQRSHLRWCAG